MRATSPALAGAVAEGVTRAGLDVVDIGLASTDQLYFASGWLGLPGVMVTASHNPAAYNGLKLCGAGARPVGRGTGLDALRDRAQQLLDAVAAPHPAAGAGRGSVRRRDVLADYGRHLRDLAPVAGRPLRVVVDAGNGMAGHTVPEVLGPLDLDVVPLYFTLDGTFPHHEANPLDPATLTDLQVAVRAGSADLGLAFDGDADRCFVVDERGEPVPPSQVTALIAVRALAAEPGARVVHNLICSRAVPEIVREHGGVPVRTPVGHSLIKAEMARTGAVVGGEHSGHFYFRDFWYADSGLLAALHVMAALAQASGPLSALLAPFGRYQASGEAQLHRRRPGRRRRDGAVALRRPADGRLRRPRRPDREPCPVVVQSEGVEHRAAAAAERRGRGCDDHDDGARPGQCDDPSRQEECDVRIDDDLLAILACPACRSPLRVDSAAQELVCTGCGRAYPVRDGIPVLLVDEAREPGAGRAGRPTGAAGARRWRVTSSTTRLWTTSGAALGRPAAAPAGRVGGPGATRGRLHRGEPSTA